MDIAPASVPHVMNVADVISGIRSYLNRDPADLNDNIVRVFLNVVNGKLNRALKQHPKMLARATATLAAGLKFLSIPTDCIQIKALHKIVYSETGSDLTPYSQTYISGPYPMGTKNLKYFVDRGNVIEVFPVPTEDTDFVMDYYAALTQLVNDGDTNWIIQFHPDIYLYGALIEASVWLKDHDSMAKWQSEFESRLASLVDSGWSGHHMTSPVVRVA